MGFKINRVKADLGSYPPYLFLAPRKFGKTTWWHKFVKEAWGNSERGLLISFGNEEGYHSLDGLQMEVVKEWNAEYDKELDLRGFVQVVDDIIENNNTYKIKGVCFDTLDTLVSVATKEVFKQHKKEKGTICKSLNDAFSGFGRGTDRLLLIVDEQIERLRSAGIAVFMLCHIKNKERTDLVSGDRYEMVTNNLQDSIYTHFADTAQIVMVGVLDREINNGKILNEDRVVYLRGNSQIDAGGRFTHIKEKIDLEPSSFMEAFEEAVKKSIDGGMDDDEFNKRQKSENELAKKNAEISLKREKETKVDENTNIELISQIKTKFIDANDSVKQEIKESITELGYSKFEEDMPTAFLTNVLEKLTA